METTNTLTDRYVREVVRRIPTDQRDDVAKELRATIADTIDGRAQHEDPQKAEWEVIAEMGDPAVLASRYADRPQWLIGPGFLPVYLRTLKMLLLVALPIVVAVLAVLGVMDGEGIGSIIGSSIGFLITVGVQMFAWVTLVFAFLEWAGGREATKAVDDVVEKWTPDEIPTAKELEQGHSGELSSVVWSVLVIGLLVWQRTAPPYSTGVDRIEVVNPELWAGLIWPIIIGLAGVAVLELVAYARRGWSMARASLYAVMELGSSGVLAWVLYDQQLLNPEFLAHVDPGSTIPNGVYTGLALIVLGFAAWDTFRRFRAAART